MPSHAAAVTFPVFYRRSSGRRTLRRVVCAAAAVLLAGLVPTLPAAAVAPQTPPWAADGTATSPEPTPQSTVGLPAPDGHRTLTAKAKDRDRQRQGLSARRLVTAGQRFATPALPGPMLPAVPPLDRAPLTNPVGFYPVAAAVDEQTHTAYVPNLNDGTVSVVNTATCDAVDSAACAVQGPTINLGGDGGDAPVGVVVDEASDTIYTANFATNSVSVIDGSTCNARVQSGCGQTPPQVAAGTNPTSLTLDPSTGTLYVSDLGGTVSVVATGRCNAHITTGCSQVPGVIPFGGTQPSGLLLDPATHTLFVAALALTATDPNEVDTVRLVDSASCNAHTTTGCIPLASTVTVGTGSSNNLVPMVIDQPSHTLFVGNPVDNTISLVDISRCTAANHTACPADPATAPAVGGFTIAFVLEPLTRTLYEVNNGNNTVTVVSTRTCNVQRPAGCQRPAGVIRGGVNTQYAALDRRTGTLYLVNGPSGGDGDLSVVNAVTCNSVILQGCSHLPPTTPLGVYPHGIALNSATHTAYIANGEDNTVSVINTQTCNTLTPTTCPTPAPTIPVGSDPYELAVDTATDTVYVTNGLSGTVSVIDGATCNATEQSGCGHTPPVITVGAGPRAVALNPATHTGYIVNAYDNTVSVINTQTCNSSTTAGCGQVPPTIAVGNVPTDIVQNSAWHTAYVVNNSDGTVSVINTSTCNATTTSGCAATPALLAAGDQPRKVALDAFTGTLYVTDQGRKVAMLDAATCRAADTTGCGQTPATAAVGASPSVMTLDPTTHTLYVGDVLDNAVSEINTTRCNHADSADCQQQAPSVPVGNGPVGIAVDHTAHTIYVVNGLEPGLDDNLSLLAAR